MNPSEPTGQPERKPWGFCETPEEKCTMNYCDENGCRYRQRHLVEPSNKAPESPSPNELTEDDRVRIKQYADDLWRLNGNDNAEAYGYQKGWEQATLYEREQSAQLRAEVSEKDKRIAELEAAVWVLLHHVPDTADFDPIREKCKTALNGKA